jgi:hypothetical protein
LAQVSQSDTCPLGNINRPFVVENEQKKQEALRFGQKGQKSSIAKSLLVGLSRLGEGMANLRFQIS